MVKEYFKSLSNISTNSVDSGYSDDEITEDQDLGGVIPRTFTSSSSLFHPQLLIRYHTCKSIEKLNKIMKTPKSSHPCALLQRSATMKIQNPDDELDLDEYTELENDIIDYCEEFWCEPIQPIVRLPAD
ncbi:hypothetical protein PVAND_007938 [Polypedilum vanderplanki]|uniref:Uncharacterized protein n=1 Tax=Polypedilum vanderplanki TaxID=319348 RepID=A0A9J6C9D0_POLVA|nr:hypothetical protein PVAND_007938 [Polypedilum vanderplanki]